MNIGMLPKRHARYRPNHTALICDGVRLSWAELDSRINRVANAMHAIGIRKGDRIATILDNGCEQLELYWAGAKIGAVVVPLSPLLRGPGLLGLLQDAGASLVVTTAGHAGDLDDIRGELDIAADRYLLVDTDGIDGYRSYRELVRAASPVAPVQVPIAAADPYNLIYSSGTTGVPKGIVLSHGVRAMYGTLFANAFRMSPESVVLHAGSLVFNGAFLTLMPALHLGGTYVLHKEFSASEFVRTVARERVTHTVLVPSQLIALLDDPDANEEYLGSLEMICSVGAPLLHEHKAELERRLPGRFFELYGLTEGFVTVLEPMDGEAKLESVGTPPPLFELAIVDDAGQPVACGEVGEIVGRGPIMMSGYWRRPDLTVEAFRDGWLRTGDMGYVDADGFLFLVDRKKDMIISGGVNVYPRDIEEVIVRHPAVREVAVFGVPDAQWGETPVAAVILEERADASPDNLREWTNGRVEAKFQRVREVVLLPGFPRGVSGKTLKRAIRQHYLSN